jgi:hypothetical protein
MISRRGSLWRPVCVALFAACIAPAAESQTGDLAVKIKFDVESDCSRPFPVQNYPVHAEFDGFLSSEGNASADLMHSTPFTPRLHFDALINAAPSPAPGGYASVKLISRTHYQTFWGSSLKGVGKADFWFGVGSDRLGSSLS